MLFSDKRNIHVMFIQPDGVELITSIYFCPKCYLYFFRGIHKKLKLTKVAQPYCPGILNNLIIVYFLEHGIRWQTYHGLITYDYETVEKVVNDRISASSRLNSTLTLISIASCIYTESGNRSTIHFKKRDPEFIPKWIASLFKHAD